MAKPEIHYISTGSNTLASGCPNAMTAVNATTTGQTAATTGANTTITFSAAVNFTGAAVGDALWFEGNAGNERHLFEISAFNPSVGACTSITTVETTGSAQSGKAFAVGGKRLHGEYNTTRYDVLDGSAGWTFWFEGTSTFDQSVRWVPANGSTTVGGISIRGDSASTRATLRQTGNAAHIDHANFLKVYNLLFTTNNATNTSTSAIRGVAGTGYAMEIHDIKVTGLFTGLWFDSANAAVRNVEIVSCVSSGVNVAASQIAVTLDGCYIHGNNTGDTSGKGGVSITMVDATPSSFRIINSVISGNKRANVTWDGTCSLEIVGGANYAAIATGGDGILITAIGTRSCFSCLNCIIYGNAGYGINGPTSATVSAILNCGVDFNAFGSNTSGARNNIAAGSNDVTLTGDPFTNAAGGDFSLNTTAGAGAAVKSVGFPVTLPGGSTTTNINIGLAQNAYSAGGGSSSFVIGG